jgi:hypothetical protein
LDINEDRNSNHRNGNEPPILDTDAEDVETLNKNMHGHRPIRWARFSQHVHRK